jgi:hypothetical protein
VEAQQARERYVDVRHLFERHLFVHPPELPQISLGQGGREVRAQPRPFRTGERRIGRNVGQAGHRDRQGEGPVRVLSSARGIGAADGTLAARGVRFKLVVDDAKRSPDGSSRVVGASSVSPVRMQKGGPKVVLPAPVDPQVVARVSLDDETEPPE